MRRELVAAIIGFVTFDLTKILGRAFDMAFSPVDPASANLTTIAMSTLAGMIAFTIARHKEP